MGNTFGTKLVAPLVPIQRGEYLAYGMMRIYEKELDIVIPSSVKLVCFQFVGEIQIEHPSVTGQSQTEAKLPQNNRNYKPNPIDISTIIKVKDEENDIVNIYWTTPSNSFGKISYKIIVNDEEKTQTTIKSLPYSVPLASIPVSFRVITKIITEDFNQYESDPSEMVTIEIVPQEEEKKIEALQFMPALPPS